MRLTNTADSYGLITQAFHWVSGLLIIGLLAMGVWMYDLPQTTTAEIEAKVWWFSLHKTLGMTAFAIAILRVIWAFTAVKPAKLANHKAHESFLSEIIHWILYAGILVTPLVGYLHHVTSSGYAPIWWPFGQSLPFMPKDQDLSRLLGDIHIVIAYMMIGSVALHVAGALKHFVVDKDQTLHRMVPGAYDGSEPLKEKKPGFPVVSVAGAVAVYAAAIVIAVVPINFPFSQNQDAVAETTVELPQGGDAPVDAWIVDAEASSLNLQIVQMGAPVDGEFTNWAATIVLDPDNLADAAISVTVDTTSLDLGDVTKDAVDTDFLNTATFPTATFTSTAVRSLGGTQYEADGLLLIRDQEQTVTLAFDLVIEDGTAMANGQTDLNRMDFGLGANTQATEGSVGFGVQISFTVVATK